jgi:hypothetical protein
MRYIEANAFLCTLLPDENEYNPLGFYMILLLIDTARLAECVRSKGSVSVSRATARFPSHHHLSPRPTKAQSEIHRHTLQYVMPTFEWHDALQNEY